MVQWMQDVQNYIQKYINGSPLVYFYLVSLMFLCFRGKEKRRMIVYPSLLIMAVILNPVLYGLLWMKLITYAFWRMLWMIPVIPVIACAVIELGSLVKKEWVCPVLTMLFIAVLFITGDNIYSQPGVFVKAENAYKIPEDSCEIAEELLALEEEPVVLAPSSIYCYLRQYNGRIHMIYGRDAEGYIKPIEDEEIKELIRMMRANGGDPARFTELARSKGVNLIVLPVDHTFGLVEAFGYEKVAEIRGMYIYRDIRE